MIVKWDRIRKFTAFLLSFLPYLPLKTFAEWRQSLLIEVPAGFEALLLCSAVGISIICQAVLLSILLRVFRWQRVLRMIAAAVAVGFLASIVVAILYSLAIPAACRLAEPILIKHRRPVPEKLNGVGLCDFPNFEIYNFVDTPPNGILGKNGQIWVRQRNTGQIGLLNIANRTVQTTAFYQNDFFVSRLYATINGRAIFVKSNDRGDPEKWWYLKGTSAQPLPIQRPDSTDDAWPILSEDGRWVAWVAPTTPGAQGVILQNMETSEIKRIASDELHSDSLRLLGFDAEHDELLVARHNWEEALGVRSADGTRLWGPIELGEWKDSVVARVLRRGIGWIGWYGRPQKNTVQWSLSGVDKTIKSAAGTEIHSVDVSADGRWIAIGTWGDYEGSFIESAVYVLDSATGKEVFRKYFPRRAWASVAFLGNDRLAYSAHSTAMMVSGQGIKVVQISH
jgi:hypothetical protein